MKIFLSLLVVLFLSNCATIISGTTTSLNLQSSDLENQDVKVQVVGKNTIQAITLPGSIFVKTNSNPLNITVKDKCFRETLTIVNPRLNYWFLGNFITGGITGTTTDALSGALWTYDDSYIVEVQPNGTCDIVNKK